MTYVRQSGFHGGEIAPYLMSRTDIDALRFACATLRNFIPAPTGAATSRPGFQFISAAKIETSLDPDARPVRLIPFTFSDEQSYVLEFGDLYCRVWQHGVLRDEVVTPYSEFQVQELDYVQSGDVVTLFHAWHAPRELKRVTPLNWTINTFSVARIVQPPAAPGPYMVAPLPPWQADATHSASRWEWVVTAVSTDNEESLPSAMMYATTQLAPDRPAYLQCAAVTGAATYNWYRGRYGVWGYVGNSSSPFFIDEGQVPNFSDRPPTARDPFAGGQNPARGTYFQQRLLTACSPSGPNRIQASQTGRFHNFDYSVPQKADDALDFTMASRQYEAVVAMVPLRQLLVLTTNTEYLIDNGEKPLTPSSINVVPLSYNGCAANLRPIVVNDTVLYVQAQQAAVRELAFATGGADRLGWKGTDLSLISSHLLAAGGHTIVDWAFQRLPYSVVWAVRDDGVLLSFTYDRELGVAAWARHDTQGYFESVCTVPEGSEDVLYAVVRRTIGGVTHRYIERMSSRFVTDRTLGCFLDCSVFYEGAPAQVFGGLGFLEGKEVTVLRDGEIEGPYTVTGSSVTLSTPGSKVFIGLPYDSDIELLDIAAASDARYSASQEVHPQQKNVTRVVWEVDATAGLSAGETFDDLIPWTAELGWVPPSTRVMNEQLVVPIASSWNRGGRAVLRQSQPLPVTVLGAVREMEVGS